MAKSHEIASAQAENEAGILRESLRATQQELVERTWQYERLEERLSGIDLQLENVGWTEAYGYTDEGPSLAQIKSMSSQIRNLTARNVWVKQGWKLRYNYVYSGGVHYENVPGRTKGKRDGRKGSAWARVQNPKNQRVFYSANAQEKREGALYSDGMVVYIGHDADHTLSELPINQISADLRNPDDPSEVWAYRRAWYSYPAGSATPEERAEWIYFNEFFDNRQRTITYLGNREPVAQRKRLFGGNVNSLPGWAFGVPDAFSGIAWARQYREILLNGKTMTDAMASIAFKIINKSKTGAESAGVKVAGGQGAGNFANILDGQDIAPMNTAGRGYDFDTSRPILAAMAAGIGVSVVALSGDPGAAGSSYGSAQTLDLPTRLMAESRRRFHVALEEEILAWMGAPDAVVYFDPIQDGSEVLRMMQGYIAKWNTGLYTADQMKDDIESLFGKTVSGSIPDGVLIPNNEHSAARRDIDTDVHPAAGANAGQGVSNGMGDTGTNGDMRTDTLS